jgi:predicted permease
VGYLIGKFSRINLNGVIDLLFWIGIPALALTSMLGYKIVLADAGKIWASSLIIILGCGAIAWLVFRALKYKHSGVYVPIMMMNTINIPFPIISLLYGPPGLAAAVLFYIPNTISMYSIGVMIMTRKHWKDGLKEMARVPALYAAVIGVGLNLLNVQFPDVVLRPLTLIGQMVVPLALLILGAKLATVQFTSIRTTVVASVIRLGGGLALGLLAVQLFHLTGIVRTVVLFDSIMPAAVNTSLLAMKYDNEPELVSSVVFLTTLASLIMIPFLLWTVT